MIRPIHRKLTWIAGAVAVLGAATGLLHPIMGWTSPRAAAPMPELAALVIEGVAPPGPVLHDLGLDRANHVRLIVVDEEPYWLASPENVGARITIAARGGVIAPDAEERYAIDLARRYARLPDTPVTFARRIDAFSNSYPSINAILPVWEVRFAGADQLSLYVDTRTDRLAAVSNTLRRTLLTIFQNVHTLSFLDGVEPLRRALIGLLVGAVLATSLMGGLMFIRGRGRKLRAWHRSVALIALPFICSFTISGLFHLFASADPSSPTRMSFDVAALVAAPMNAEANEVTAAASSQGDPIWRVQTSNSVSYFDAAGRAIALTDDMNARAIAGLAPNASATLVTNFTPEYGFANKRLPVWRVADGASLRFVDVYEAAIVARGRNALQSAEAWSFDTIHKWSFFNPIGRRNRDILMMLAAGFIIAASVLGLALRLASKPKAGVKS